MANDLTMTGAGYGAGKFGNALTSGSGATSVYPNGTSWTFEGWFRTTNNNGQNSVLFSIGGELYVGMTGAGKPLCNLISSPTAVTMNDGNRAHFALCGTPDGIALFIGGARVGSGAAFAPAAPSADRSLTIGTHQKFGFNWIGEIDEFAIFSMARYSDNFTPPTAPYTGSETGLLSLYHFNNNGANSAGVVAPSQMSTPAAAAGNASATVTLVAPADGGSAISGFTVTSNPAGGVDPHAGTTGLSHTVTGLNNGTAYTFTATATNDAGTSPASPASNSVTPAANQNNALTGAAANLVYSPGNWNVGVSAAKTIHGGAYFRTLFGGNSCALQFDLTGLATGYPKLEYRVDGVGPWTTFDVAATVAIAMPAETTAYASHLLEVNVRATTRTGRWALQGIVSLLGIILDAGKALSKPGQRPSTGYVMGDSITEGLKSLSSSEDTVTSSNGMQSYASYLGAALGAEIGVIGFSGQGFGNGGDGSVPVFGNTCNLVYAGVARTFSPAPDFIVINQGTNDGGNNIVAAATAVLNGLLAATPSTTKIFVLRPFNGNQAGNLQSAIAACSTPARVFYVDTTGFFASANSSDGLHPYGWEHMSHIGPAVAATIRPLLTGVTAAPTLTARTVSVTLGTDASTPAANLTGLKISYFDEATPDLHTVARFKTAVGTTNASGVLSFTAQSTLAAGGIGYLVVQGAGGVHYNAPVVVA